MSTTSISNASYMNTIANANNNFYHPDVKTTMQTTMTRNNYAINAVPNVRESVQPETY